MRRAAKLKETLWLFARTAV